MIFTGDPMKGRKMRTMKHRNALALIILMALLVQTLTSCGRSEFGVTENTGKRITITAEKADKDAFLMVGALEAADGEQIVIASDLAKGSVKVEILRAPEEQQDDQSLAIDDEPILMANVSRTDTAAGGVTAGSYLLRATCIEKATGTIQVEVTPAAEEGLHGD